MSTPVTMPMAENAAGQTGSGGIAAYVAAVRAQLDDLQPDEVEELTGGLAADLTDALAGRDVTPVALFGAPVDYAAELRSAAGLPARSARGARFGRGGGLAALDLGLREVRDQVTAPLTRQPWWPGVQDFLVTLRPAWWLARAYVAYQFAMEIWTQVDQVLPFGFVSWLMLGVLVVGSVELGRRRWAHQGLWPWALIAAGNAFAGLIVLLVALVGGGVPANSDHAANSTEVITEAPSTGLFNAGYQVVNVFPYDRNGKPLTDVQLYDDRGRPLAPSATTYTGAGGERVRLVPSVTTNGTLGLNIYPLLEQVTDPGSDPQTGEPLPRTGVGVLRAAALPDPTQAAVIPLPTPKPTPTP